MAGKSEPYYQAARLVLKEQPEIEVGEFAQRIFAIVQPSGPDLETMKTSNRMKWENLVDWAKSRLTREELIEYRTINGKRHVCWRDD